MVLKLEVIKERLQHMKKALDELKSIKKISEEEFMKDLKLQWSVERGLQIICEAVFDIGNHILVGGFNSTPTDYQSIINMLAEKRVISAELSKRFTGLGGFRNILVHDYTEIDSKEIYNKFKTKLDDFEMFIKEIIGWLQKGD